MEYTLENEYLKITVTQWGAQLKSVICKADGTQRMWQATDAQGRLHFGEPQHIILVAVGSIEGDPECGMVADAVGQGGLVRIFHGEGVMHRILFQPESRELSIQ